MIFSLSTEIIAKAELKKNNINLSKESVNLLIEKSNNDRNNLKNEIEKINQCLNDPNCYNEKGLNTLAKELEEKEEKLLQKEMILLMDSSLTHQQVIQPIGD